MKLSCLQENLSRGLAIVGRAVATRTTLPITQNVLLTTDQSMLKLSATNLEIAITTWIGAQVEEEGSITVPARLLTGICGLPALRTDRCGYESQAPRLAVDLRTVRGSHQRYRSRRISSDTCSRIGGGRENRAGGVQGGHRPGGLCGRYRRVPAGADGSQSGVGR